MDEKPDDPVRVLVVEDEDPIRDGLVSLFQGQGWKPTGASSGADALDELHDGTFDLVVLDLMIPEPAGLDVLRRLREKDDETPVLVLTALGAEDDIVRGLEAGADDYLTKPFGIKELLARARGLLRRKKTVAPTIAVGDAQLDPAKLEVSRRGKVARLTAREADLLAYLVNHPSLTIPREDLLVSVWGYRDGSIQTRTVDVHVQQLRAKLHAVGAGDWIRTIRGRGYVFEP